MKTTAIVVISLLIGLFIGWSVFDIQVVKTYEDGSFIGCYIGGGCND